MAQRIEPPSGDVAFVRSRSRTVPEVALILGSGLGEVADAVTNAADIQYGELAGFPTVAAVMGHANVVRLGALAGRDVVAFSGRAHGYQGCTALECAYPVRLAAALGARTLIVTNAAGGIAPGLSAGDLALISDHINLTGDNPLRGWTGPEGGTPFVPMVDAYDPALRSIAREAAAEVGVALKEGVYAGVLGPNYETAAEVRALSTAGADLVGMSTVHEVITARALGMRALGVSLVTNVAAGKHESHEDVLAAAALGAKDLVKLLIAILGRL